MKADLTNSKPSKGRKRSLVPSFLSKLYQILEVYFLCKNKDRSIQEIVQWNESGKSFVIKDLPEFIDKVIPTYFKHNNFSSFVRQLNMYDFHKTRNSNGDNIFFHKLFIKGQK